jgi:HEAT repeat protein
MTRSLLGDTDFAQRDGFQALWSSMEELLLTYNERPFVSAGYKTGLDQVAARAEQMAAEVPDDLAELIDTLGQDNVRRLSVRLLIDLLRLERDPARAPELAGDVAALAEDLLLAGDYDSVLSVVTALQEQAADRQSASSQGSRVALDGLVSTIAFVEAAELLGGMTEAEAATFASVCDRIGPAAIDGLRSHFEQDAMTPGRERAARIVNAFGSRAISRLVPLVSSANWAAQRNAAELLGATGAPEAVPLLQPLLRGRDPRVSAAAVRALARIKDPAAARAVHTALRAATGDQRRTVVDALVAERDVRVVPVLVRIVEESDPFGADHTIVLETVGALSRVGDDQAVPALSALMRRKKFLAPKKGKALKETSLAALRAIQTPAATRAIDEAARTGDRVLRKLARAGA